MTMHQEPAPPTNNTPLPYERRFAATSLEQDPICGNNEQTSAALTAAASIQLGCEIQNTTFIPSQCSTAVSIGTCIAVARFLVSFGDLSLKGSSRI